MSKSKFIALKVLLYVTVVNTTKTLNLSSYGMGNLNYRCVREFPYLERYTHIPCCAMTRL